jgi:hypothetical protein
MKLCALALAILISSLVISEKAAAAPVLDPVADTFNTGTIDIVSYELLLSPSFTLNIGFNSAIAAPSTFAPNSVLGFVDLDTDANAATGGTMPFGGAVTGGNSWLNFFIPPNPGTPTVPGPTVALGIEFYLDLGSELFHPGLVDIVSAATNLTVGVAPITFGTNSLSITFATALLGSPYQVNYGILVGDFLSPTDRAPNGADPASTAVPEPSTLTLVGIGAALVARRRRP